MSTPTALSPGLSAEKASKNALLLVTPWGFPGGATGKEPACQCRRHKRHGFDPWVGKIPWWRQLQPTPVFLPGKPNGQRSLADCSPWGCKESDTTEVT